MKIIKFKFQTLYDLFIYTVVLLIDFFRVKWSHNYLHTLYIRIM